MGIGSRSGNDTCVVDYVPVLRHADGEVTVTHDRHVEGLFARARWLQWFDEAGFSARSSLDSSGRVIFIGTIRADGGPESPGTADEGTGG